MSEVVSPSRCVYGCYGQRNHCVFHFYLYSHSGGEIHRAMSPSEEHWDVDHPENLWATSSYLADSCWGVGAFWIQTVCYFMWEEPWIMWYDIALMNSTFFLPIPVLMVLYGKMIITLKAEVPQSDAQGAGAQAARKSRLQVIAMLLSVLVIFIACLLPVRVYLYCFTFIQKFYTTWILGQISLLTGQFEFCCMSITFTQSSTSQCQRISGMYLD